MSRAIIPTTLKETKLSSKGPGDPINLEADVIGKHILHYMKGAAGGLLTKEKLSRYGFA